MAYRSEADEIRTLAKVLAKGYIYRGLKPVNWCFDCGSALAEAEVEYLDRADFAVDVGFPFAESAKVAKAFGLEKLPAEKGWIVIWTTTPWTLPANQALNVHPDNTYGLVETERGLLILADDLRDACLARYKLSGRTLASCKGTKLEGIGFRHPFYDRLSPVYLGEYVTLEQGTGVVHSAPAYGVEDFVSCRRYGMKDGEILTPVMGDAKYDPSLPLFGGMDIWKANPKIVEKIRESGNLFSHARIEHSYMHCWRHKTPVIYRASQQWFVAMDEPPGFNGAKPPEPLRATALRGVEATRFFPAWGKARLHGMIAGRPDWTLSRQRPWGVPMPFFIHRPTGELPHRSLLTHGFFVDGEGRKMSKSQGNVIEPQKVSGTLGAEILRLWVAATDYSGELSISDEILKRVVEGYRRIRNTLRFLLANTSDFDPKRHAMPVERWVEIDRYALALTAGLQVEILAGS